MPKKKPTHPVPLTKAQRSKRFRMRYQDGIVEIGLGILLFLETLLNESEHLLQNTQSTRLLVLLQPFLSMAIFVVAMIGIDKVRHHLIRSRNGPQEIPLASPLLWTTLLLMVMLLAAPLVWPLQPYSLQIFTYITASMGLLIGGAFIFLGIQNRLPRFWIIGIGCVLLTGLFSFLGQPGTLPNRLVILWGIAGEMLISGGYMLQRYLHLTQPSSSSVKIEKKTAAKKTK